MTSSASPFAGFNSRPSVWGYNWDAAPAAPQHHHVNVAPAPKPQQQQQECPSSPNLQYANLPAQLLGTLKREKKPFTYTPGGVNLNQVLEQRLQKRLQRKKHYNQEKEQQPPKQVVVSPTYNSPLDMYSMDNALEALEVQAEFVAADKSLRGSATLPRNHTFRFNEEVSDLSDGGRGVAQSKAFRVLQIITDTEEDNSNKTRSPTPLEETRFRGLRESSSIPSRFFQTLQKITGTDDQETQEQTVQPQVAPSRPVPAMQQPRPKVNYAPQQQQLQNNSAAPAFLKRPADFLPIKTAPSGFRPVRPVFQKQPVATTDF